jgi:hypothetical protein
VSTPARPRWGRQPSLSIAGEGMPRLRASLILKVFWCAASLGASGVLLATGADASNKRLWLLTLLSWFSFPSSFAIVPLVNRAVSAFDVENIKLIDGAVAIFVGLGGYIQWFHLIPFIARRVKAS